MKFQRITSGVVLLVVFAAHSISEGQDTIVLKSVNDAGLYAAAADGNSNRGDDGRMDFNTTGDGLLVQFDLAGVLGPGESISGATLELFAARSSNDHDFQLVGYPLAAAWGEGVGNSGISGGTGFPWGPASVGDAVYNYKEVTDVGAGTAPFDATDVATGGVAWNTPGGQGIGTDVVDSILFDVAIAGGGASDEGAPYTPIEFNASGIGVLNDMAEGLLTNNGFNLFTTGGDVDGGNGWRVATRELAARRGTDALAPTLTMTVVPEPSSISLVFFGIMGLFRIIKKR
jgi:hypothetical protein